MPSLRRSGGRKDCPGFAVKQPPASSSSKAFGFFGQCGAQTALNGVAFEARRYDRASIPTQRNDLRNAALPAVEPATRDEPQTAVTPIADTDEPLAQVAQFNRKDREANQALSARASLILALLCAAMSVTSCPTSVECGGCPLISYAPEQAREFYATQVRDAFSRYLITRVPHVEWFSIASSAGYRRRIRLRVFDDGHVGFFNEAKYSHCGALSPALRAVLIEFLRGAAEHREALRQLQYLELREPDLDHRPAAYFVKRNPSEALPLGMREELGNWLSGYCFAIAGEPPSPVPAQRLALPSVWHYVPISSFLQVNEAVNRRLVSDLLLRVQTHQVTSFCDLYAGAGNFALPLLSAGLIGCAVELDSAASMAARRSALEQSLVHGDFASGDAGEYAAQAAHARRSYDLVLIDPPRGGVRSHLDAMASLSRRHLVYLSCNVQSLARDLAALEGLGFSIQTVGTYDMFQHTEHVETMVWLERVP